MRFSPHLTVALHDARPGELRAVHAVALPGEAPEMVQLLPLGTIAGRDGRGPYKIGDRAQAQAIIAASLAYAGSMDLPIDYDHQIDLAAVKGVGGTAPAAGWIKSLELRDDGIWGRVEWTEAAAAKLRAKEYRYLSPVFAHAKDGTVRAILRAGLTNNPNLDLVALATAHHQQEVFMPEWLKKLLQALGLPENPDEATALARAQTLVAAHAAMERIAVAAGLAKDAAADAIVTAINAARTPDPAKFVPAETVTALQTQVAALQAQIADGAAERAVDKAIADGKLLPALRDWGLALHKSDKAKFDDFNAKAPVVVRPGAAGPEGAPQTGQDGLTDEERAICAATGVDPEKFKAQKAADAKEAR